MLTRITYWATINGFFVVAMYYGFFGGITAAENLAIGMAWLSIFISLFASNAEVQVAMRERGRAVPKVVNLTFQVGATLALLYGGWWITAFCYMLHTFILEAGWIKSNNK